jgi:hypothetical protein
MHEKSIESWCEDDQYNYAGLLVLLHSRAGTGESADSLDDPLAVYLQLQASLARLENLAPSTELRALSWRIKTDAIKLLQCANALEADALEIERRGL